MADRILRLYALLFHFLLAALLLGLAVVSLASGHDLKLEVLPWKEESLTRWVLGFGLFGMLSVLLAAARKVAFLFAIWSLAVAVLLVRGYFLSPYVFSGPADFGWAVLFTLGALLALVASLRNLRQPKRPNPLV